MTSAIQALLNGTYEGQIQDLLQGQSGSLTIRNGAVTAATGAASGLVSASTSATAYGTQTHDTISLSPQAQLAYSKELVGLALLEPLAPTRAAVTQTAADVPASTTSPAASSASTTTSITDVLAQAKQAFADPTATFYAAVDQVNGPAQFASFFNDPAQKASFIAAYDNHTLTISNAADVAGLADQNTATFAAQSETTGGSSDQTWRNQQDQANGTYSTGLEFPGLGGLYVTWAKPSAAPATA